MLVTSSDECPRCFESQKVGRCEIAGMSVFSRKPSGAWKRCLFKKRESAGRPDVYTHLFDEAKHDGERRQRYSDGYGKHLRDVNGMSSEGRNSPQSEPLEDPANVASIG